TPRPPHRRDGPRSRGAVAVLAHVVAAGGPPQGRQRVEGGRGRRGIDEVRAGGAQRGGEHDQRHRHARQQERAPHRPAPVASAPAGSTSQRPRSRATGGANAVHSATPTSTPAANRAGGVPAACSTRPAPGTTRSARSTVAVTTGSGSGTGLRSPWRVTRRRGPATVPTSTTRWVTRVPSGRSTLTTSPA